MPIAVIVIGAVLIDLAFRGTEHEFAQQLGKDFGAGSQFWSWAAALAVFGLLGYVSDLRGVSSSLMGLVIVVLVLRNGGLFDRAKALITSPPQAAPAIPLSSYGGSSSSSSSSSSSGSSSGGGGLFGGLFGGGGSGSSAGSALQTAGEVAAIAALA